jgi:Protein of unknown function (DUF1573)
MRRTACVVLTLASLHLLFSAQRSSASPVISVQATSTIAKGSTYVYPSTTPVGVATSVLFTIYNTGNAALNISNPAGLVSGSSAFVEIVSAPSSIAAGGNGVFRVRLISSTPGTYTGTVSISSNDPVNNPFSFNIQGTVTGPVIGVQALSAAVSQGSTFTFPYSTPAGTPISVLFTITNTGNANLNLSNPTTLVSGSAFSEIATPTTPVAAGGNTTFRVRLYSTTAGTFSGTVSISSDDSNHNPFTFTVTGTVTPPPAPVIGVSGVAKGSNYTFPSTPAGTPTSVLFTITNTGNANLNLSNPTTLVTGSAFYEIANPTTPVAPGGSTTFRVRLQSGAPGTYSGTVSIASDDPVTPTFTFTVSGTVTGAVIGVQALSATVAKGSTFTFPYSTPAGTPTSVLFTITNTGSVNLNLSNATTLVSGAAFSEIATPTTPVAPGGSTTFRVRLLSNTPGIYSGTVSISSDDPVTPTYSFTVSGTVTGPVIGVLQGTTTIAKGSTFTFPSSTPAGTPTSVLFTITNTGSVNLNLSNATTLVSGAAFSEIATPTTPIAPGGSTTFRVRLQSNTPGTYSGTVSISSDDINNNPFTFTVTGTVTGPVISVQQGTTLVANGSTFTFPSSTPAGVPTSVLFTIYNTGSATLNISNSTTLVSGNGFSEIYNAPASIPAGGNGVFRVRLQSATAGTYSGTVSISSDDLNHNPYTFTVSGTVTAAGVIGVQAGSTVIANGSTFTFPSSTPAPVPVSVLFTITNSGAATLTISNPTTLVSGNGFSEIVNAPSTIDANGGSGVFRVRLQSATPNTYTGTVTIQSSDPVTPTFSFTIQGTVTPAPAIGVLQGSTAVANGSTFTFPATPAGTAETVSFTITNTGSAPLNLSNPAALVSGTGFSQTQTPTTPVAAGGSTSFAVQLLANSGGSYTGTVTIASDDPLQPSYSFTVAGTVNLAPHLRVVQYWNNVTVVPGGVVTFPDVAVGSPESLQLLLVNDGPGTLAVNNPTALVGGACYSQLDQAPASIAAGQNAGVRVRLQCGTAGVQAGTFSVSSNDPLTPTYGVNLSGAVGLTLPPLRVESGDGIFVTHQGTYSFPDTGVGQVESRAFTIFNDGAQDFTIANPGSMVSEDPAFSESLAPASATVAAGGSQVFRVRLLSSQTGAHYGQVTIASADPTQKPFLFGVVGNVQAPDFTMGINPTAIRVQQGQGTAAFITFASLFGFNSNVTLSLTGLPAGVSATFTPVTVAPGGTSELQLQASADAATGNYTLTLTATGGGVTHSLSVSLTVLSAPQATLSVLLNPTSASVQPGGSATYTVLTTGSNLSGDIALSVSGLPAGFGASLDNASVPAGGSAHLTLTAPASAGQSSNGFVVTAAVGALTATANGTLVVGPPPMPGAPVVNSLSPSPILSGQVTVVTVVGANFGGATLSIPTTAPNNTQPQARVFPTAQLQSISPDGTTMQVAIDATAPGILDYYNLLITNSAGSAAAHFRVIPPGPIVDAYSPGAVPQGTQLTVLSFVGMHLRNVTVTTDAPASLSIFGLDSREDDRTNALMQVSPSAPTGNVTVTLTDPYGRTVSLTIAILPAGTAPRRAIRKVWSGKDIGSGAMPDVYFQEYTPRRWQATRVTKTGIVIDPQANDVTMPEDVDLTLYVHVAISLAYFNWQTIVVFDPVTHALGDAVLHNLPLGQTVHLGAFVFSFAVSVEANIYWSIDLSTGDVSFPLVCYSQTIAIEAPAGPSGVYSWQYCAGSGSNPTSGSTANITVSGGPCAQVTQTGFSDGAELADVTQTACCSQPIDVHATGTTFVGTGFETSYNVDFPAAAATTPAATSCPCPCALTASPQVVIKPGDQLPLTATIVNTTNDTCTYNISYILDSSGLLQVSESTKPPVTLNGGEEATTGITVSVVPNMPAKTAPKVTISVSNGACAQDVTYCVIPTGEQSSFYQWKPSNQGTQWDVARFTATLSDSQTDFTGRTLTESQLGSSHDSCFVSGMPANRNFNVQPVVTGGTWTVGQIFPDFSGTVNTNQYGFDSVGLYYDAPTFYSNGGSQLPCSIYATQNMSIDCPWNPEKYKSNLLEMDVYGPQSKAIVISRDNAQSSGTPPPPQ